jgi:hypothetical protein
VDDNVREHQPRIKQVQDLLDQGAKHRMVFILDVGKGSDLGGLVVFHGRVGSWLFGLRHYKTSSAKNCISERQIFNG